LITGLEKRQAELDDAAVDVSVTSLTRAVPAPPSAEDPLDISSHFQRYLDEQSASEGT